MYMGTEYLGEIDRFEEGPQDVYAKLHYWEEGNFARGAGVLTYPQKLIPSNGRFSAARYDVLVVITDSSQDISLKVRDDVSVSEFESVLAEVDFEYYLFNLENTEKDMYGGSIMVHPDSSPIWVDTKGDHCFITIHLKYDHSRTKEETGYSEEKIRGIRKNSTANSI